MSVSVSMHTKKDKEFKVEAYLTSGAYESNYAVVSIKSREEQYGSQDDVTIFPSYEQVKIMHKELSKLMRKIREVEKQQKVEV